MGALLSLLLPERFPRRLNYLTKILLGEKIPSLWDSKEALRNTGCSSLCKGGAASPGWSGPTLKTKAWGKVSRRQENNGDMTECGLSTLTRGAPDYPRDSCHLQATSFDHSRVLCLGALVPCAQRFR